MIIDKWVILNIMLDDMEKYRGEVRRYYKQQAKSSHVYDRLSRIINIFYLRNCPCEIIKELNELISEDTPVTKLLRCLKERILANEIVHDFIIPSITMEELVG